MENMNIAQRIAIRWQAVYNKKNPPLPGLSDKEIEEISYKPLDPKDFI